MNRTKPFINKIYGGDSLKWKVKRYINGQPIEDYTEEEKKAFFTNTLTKAFKELGYKMVNDFDGKKVVENECLL